MSSLFDYGRRTGNWIIGRGLKTSGERKREEAAVEQQRKDKMFASGEIPDEDFLKRAARKKAARRRGSRIETVLTEDTLG